jgi:spermidine dehydrogenase
VKEDAHDHDLGMGRTITRRDFLNGVALTVGATMLPLEALAGQDAASEPWKQEPFLAQGITQDDPWYYPPALTGLRGSPFEVAHQLPDGNHWDDLGAEAETDNHLVIVGGGSSGLAAAYFFRKAAGPKAEILILDNHDDFGGHAKRNEFQSGKHFLIGYGGTQKLRLIFTRQQTFQTFRKVDEM